MSAAKNVAMVLLCRAIVPPWVPVPKASWRSGPLGYARQLSDVAFRLLVECRASPAGSRLAAGGCQIGMLKPVRQIGFAGLGLQHDRAARQRIDPVGERQCFLDQ